MKIKKGIFAGMAALALLFGMTVLLTGCASAPPTAFETAESLEGTAWFLNSTLVVMNDKTSGVFTDSDFKETAFTYTAVYDAKTRSFAGTIKLEDDRVAEFSAKKAVLIGWTLTAKALQESERSVFEYITPEQLAAVYRQNKVTAEVVEKYGREYLGLRNKVWKRGSENFHITYDFTYGLYQTTPGAAIQIVRTAYKLHSEDGATMTLLSFDTTTHQYAGVEGAGTFNINVSGDTVTITNGTGAGTSFNGTYKEVK
ncbi:MAG: hypothetical protein LBH43_20355 [Treponema sp.]|jgi:hypothetical protein|nr:hypothetical protein [Treponema sp.]